MSASGLFRAHASAGFFKATPELAANVAGRRVPDRLTVEGRCEEGQRGPQ
jgi:hypothetical protein